MHRHNAFNLTTFVMVFGLVVFISAGHHYARGQEPALNAVLRLPEGVKMEALSDPKEAARWLTGWKSYIRYLAQRLPRC